MPLVKGRSKKAVSENISRESAAGRPHDQAVAIALHTQDEAKKRAGWKAERSSKKY
jgi:hypothetical protein